MSDLALERAGAGAVAKRARVVLAIAITVLAAAITVVLARVAPRFSRHEFVDTRTLLGVPNFADVGSNVAFLVIGAIGLIVVARMDRARFVDARERWPWLVLFAGVILVAFGSAYYHLAPDDDRLVWDRLPITVAFTAFFAAVVAERVRVGLGLAALSLLVPLGALSVLYWASTGDLRPYLMVQVGPIMLVPLLVLGFPPRYTRGHDVLVVVGFYALAKAAELLERPIYSIGEIMSGHALKHVIAGLGLYAVVVMLRRRTALPRN